MSDISSSRNQRIVDELLADAGMQDADDLRPVLLELRALAADSPRPSAEVEALMAPAATLAAVPAAAAAPASRPAPADELRADALPADELSHGELAVDELAARRRRKRRLPLTALSVAAALAAGGAAAAASDEDFRHTLGNVRHAVTFVVGTMTSGTGGKTPVQPSPETHGTGYGTPAPAPTSQVPSPADGESVPGGQAGGVTADPATPSPGSARTSAPTLPAKPDPREPGTIPGSGQLPTGKPLPSPSVSPDPSGLIPAPPVELPELPGQSPSR